MKIKCLVNPMAFVGSRKFLLIFTVAVTLTCDHHTKFENETLKLWTPDC